MFAIQRFPASSRVQRREALKGSARTQQKHADIPSIGICGAHQLLVHGDRILSLCDHGLDGVDLGHALLGELRLDGSSTGVEHLDDRSRAALDKDKHEAEPATATDHRVRQPPDWQVRYATALLALCFPRRAQTVHREPAADRDSTAETAAVGTRRHTGTGVRVCSRGMCVSAQRQTHQEAMSMVSSLTTYISWFMTMPAVASAIALDQPGAVVRISAGIVTVDSSSVVATALLANERSGTKEPTRLWNSLHTQRSACAVSQHILDACPRRKCGRVDSDGRRWPPLAQCALSRKGGDGGGDGHSIDNRTPLSNTALHTPPATHKKTPPAVQIPVVAEKLLPRGEYMRKYVIPVPDGRQQHVRPAKGGAGEAADHLGRTATKRADSATRAVSRELSGGRSVERHEAI